MFRLFGLAAGDGSSILLLLGQLIRFQRDLTGLLHACKRAISTAFGHRQAGNTQGSNYKGNSEKDFLIWQNTATPPTEFPDEADDLRRRRVRRQAQADP